MPLNIEKIKKDFIKLEDVEDEKIPSVEQFVAIEEYIKKELKGIEKKLEDIEKELADLTNQKKGAANPVARAVYGAFAAGEMAKKKPEIEKKKSEMAEQASAGREMMKLWVDFRSAGKFCYPENKDEKLRAARDLCDAGYINNRYLDFIIDSLNHPANKKEASQGTLFENEVTKSAVVRRIIDRDEGKGDFIRGILKKDEFGGKHYTNLLAIELNKQRNFFSSLFMRTTTSVDTLKERLLSLERETQEIHRHYKK